MIFGCYAFFVCRWCTNISKSLMRYSSALLQGTAVEGTIQQLFEGHHMNYIECINVDYKSTRKESFYGIDLCFSLRRGLRGYDIFILVG